MVEARSQSNVEDGSGNVFADIGLPEAEELQAKFRLIHAINKIIAARGLTQKEAARLLGINQPKISALQHCKLEGFSVARLMHFATALGYDVLVELRAKEDPEALGCVVVVQAA